MRWARLLLGLYAVVLAVVLLSPTSTVQAALVWDLVRVLQLLGLSGPWASFTRVEELANVVIIAPLSFLGSLALPRWRWQDWTAYVFLGVACIELFQGLVLPDRQASFSDIVANTAGAAAGALLARGLQRRVRHTMTRLREAFRRPGR